MTPCLQRDVIWRRKEVNETVTLYTCAANKRNPLCDEAGNGVLPYSLNSMQQGGTLKMCRSVLQLQCYLLRIGIVVGFKLQVE
eukprot:scaffold10163_cov270-Chaetoceros_neogracile.AAC.2